MFLLIENSRIPIGIEKRNCASKINSNIRRKSGRTDNALEKIIKREYLYKGDDKYRKLEKY